MSYQVGQSYLTDYLQKPSYRNRRVTLLENRGGGWKVLQFEDGDRSTVKLQTRLLDVPPTVKSQTRSQDVPPNGKANHSIRVKIGAMNMDLSSKPEFITKMRDLLKDYDFVTVSEVLSKRSCDSIKPTHLGFWAFKVTAREYLAVYWDPDNWELSDPPSESNRGKYCAALFEHKQTKITVAYVAVHLPHKQLKKEARNAVAKVVKEYAGEADLVIVAGDFNAQPNEIQAFLKPTKMAITCDPWCPTTTNTRKPDNIVVMPSTRVACILKSSVVHTRVTEFTHRPIEAIIRIKAKDTHAYQ